jgi:hypothetical protein
MNALLITQWNRCWIEIINKRLETAIFKCKNIFWPFNVSTLYMFIIYFFELELGMYMKWKVFLGSITFLNSGSNSSKTQKQN